MSITLRYFFDIPDGALLYDNKTVQFCQDSFNKSIASTKEYFTSDQMDADSLEIKVFIHNELNKNERDIEPIRYMMSDIKNEESCTFKLLSPLFSEADIIEKKISMLRYLLEKYFISICLYNTRCNDDNFVECVHDYWGSCNYKYVLPKNVITKYKEYFDEYGANIVDLTELTVEELATYVIPFYYLEIGAWYNEKLRENKSVMSKLTLGWLN